MLCRDVGRRASTRPCRVSSLSLLKHDIAYSAIGSWYVRNAHFCHVIVTKLRKLVLPPLPACHEVNTSFVYITTTFSLAPQCGKLHITGSLCVCIPLYNYVPFNFSFNIPVVCVSIKALLT